MQGAKRMHSAAEQPLIPVSLMLTSDYASNRAVQPPINDIVSLKGICGENFLCGENK